MALQFFPLFSLPREMLHEIFRHIPNREVFRNLPLVSHQFNDAVQHYSVFLPELVLCNPTVNLLKNLTKKVIGCRHLTLRMTFPLTEEIQRAFLELCDNLASSVEEILWDDCNDINFPQLQDLFLELLKKAKNVKSLEILTVCARIIRSPLDFSKHEINPSIEVFKTNQALADLQILKTYPNLRDLHCNFKDSSNFNGFAPENINLRVFRTGNPQTLIIPSIFIHLEELHLHNVPIYIFRKFARKQKPTFDRLTRLTLSMARHLVFPKFTDYFVSAVRVLCNNLPLSLGTVDSLNITKNYGEIESEENSTGFKDALKSLPACIVKIKYLDEVIRAP
jgi:hypothetical protein